MAMDKVNINGTYYPFKKTTRAMRRLEKKGVDLTGLSSQIELMVQMAYEFLYEGYLIENSKPLGGPAFMTLDDLEAFDAEADSSPIEYIINSITETEKKLTTSTLESGGTKVLESIPKAENVKTTTMD